MAEGLPEGTVTVLFTDVEGSTDLTTRRGDEAAQAILRAQRELVRHQIDEHGGHEVKGTGDGFMVAFSSARRAVACAIGIQRAIDEHNGRQPPEQRARVRVGMNTGEVIREEADLFGAAVNAAARIAAKAEGSQILVSETIKALLGPAKDVQFLDRGRFRLKGFPERWRLFEVVWQQQAAPIAAPVLAERTPFVGREAEREELRGYLERAVSGQGSLVMIGGEPGVGKTRLAEEVAAEARERGMLALTGRCYEMTGAPPYIPFVEMLEAAGRSVPPEALRAALGESAPEVAKLVPELRRTFPDIPSPPELPPEQERRYLFNGVRDFVARAGRAQPLLLVLDDLQWADDSSMLLLLHIAQQLSEMPVLVLATYRDMEVAAGSPLARGLEELTRQRLAHRISVKRLPEAGVAAMLRALSGREPPKPLVDVIFSETEGNPFFVEEVLKHLAEEGRLFDEKGGWRAGLAVSDTDVPDTLRLVIDRRLERLDEDVRRALTAAAVLGRSFSFDLLAALSEMDGDALLDAVDEAERAQLLTSASEGPEVTFRFSHELIRQTLLSGVSAARRQRLHLRAALEMEQAHTYAQHEHAPDVAYHLAEAGATADPAKTAHYLSLAGDRALSSAAYEEGLRHYQDALALQPADDRRGRADLLYKRGLALRSLGRWEEALADWQESLRAHEALGNADAAARIYATITRQLLWGQRYLEALELSQRGLASIGKRETPERCILLCVGGVTLSLAGFYEPANGMIDRALALAQQIGDQHLLGRVMGYKAVHHFCYGQMREQAEAGLAASDLLRPAGDPWDLADALWVTEIALLALGRLEESASIGAELQPLADRLGHLGALIIAGRLRAFRQLLLTGDIGGFEAFAKEDFRLSAFQPVGESYTFLGLGDFWRGRWEQALRNLEQGARLELPGMNRGTLWASLLLAKAYAENGGKGLALLREKRGDVPVQVGLRRLVSLVLGLLGAARFSGLSVRMLWQMLRQMRRTKVEEFLPRRGQANTLGSWALLLSVTEALAVSGRPERAARLYPLVLEAIEKTGSLIRNLEPRLLQTVAGIAAAAGRQWEKAEAHYQTALRQAHELPIVIEQPEVRRFYAQMLIERDAPGDRDKARQLLAEAIAMYRQIGMPKHLEMAEAMLAGC